MSYLNNENIVSLYNVFERTRQICMAMEYAGGGDLLDHILRQHQTKSQKENHVNCLFSYWKDWHIRIHNKLFTGILKLKCQTDNQSGKIGLIMIGSIFIYYFIFIGCLFF